MGHRQLSYGAQTAVPLGFANASQPQGTQTPLSGVSHLFGPRVSSGSALGRVWLQGSSPFLQRPEFLTGERSSPSSSFRVVDRQGGGGPDYRAVKTPAGPES